MSGLLDLAAVHVLDIARFELNAPFATRWPCPGCGDDRELTGAWALKVRNRTGLALERAVVVCNDCLVDFGETAVITDRAREPVAVNQNDDPIRMLRDAFDTDSVEFDLESQQ